MSKASRLAGWLLSGLTILAAVVLASGCTSANEIAENEKTVLVAGATGGTGRALVRNLLERGYTVRAFVRDEDKARVVLGDAVGYAVGDVRDLDSVQPAMEGVAYVISAIGASRSDPANNPEAVDFGGVKNLADAAATAKVERVVLVSSSGVTQEDHFLNKAFDNVLLWKFKGEEALRDSGVDYTIVRPGGLINTPGGKDALVFAQGDSTAGRISREDVALICVAALNNPDAHNKTFETYSSEEPGENNWVAMFAELTTD